MSNTLQDLPNYNKAIDYEDMLSGKQTEIEDLPHTPEKTRVSIKGVIREVSLERITNRYLKYDNT